MSHLTGQKRKKLLFFKSNQANKNLLFERKKSKSFFKNLSFFGFCSTLRTRHTWSWTTSAFFQVPFAFKDSVIERFCNWYHLSHFAAFFNEIGSQVIHRDTLWEPSTTVVGRQKNRFLFLKFFFSKREKKKTRRNLKKRILLFQFLIFFFDHHSGIHSIWASLLKKKVSFFALILKALEPLSEYRTQSLSREETNFFSWKIAIRESFLVKKKSPFLSFIRSVSTVSLHDRMFISKKRFKKRKNKRNFFVI